MMDEETIKALSAPAPPVDAIHRWIHEQQRIAHELSQLDAAAEAVLKILEAKTKALRDQQATLEGFAPAVLEHFQAREKEERSGRTFADVEQGYVVKLKKIPARLSYRPSGWGDFFAWDDEHENEFSRFKVKATMTMAQVKQFQAFFPDIAKFSTREPVMSDLSARFKATGEVPPGFDVVGGHDSVTVEAPKAVGPGRPIDKIESGDEEC